jgi:hypothetical protein
MSGDCRAHAHIATGFTAPQQENDTQKGMI